MLPLVAAMTAGDAATLRAESETRVQMIKWMIKEGANPLQVNDSSDPSWSCQVCKPSDKDKTLISTPYRGRSAISFACEHLAALQRAHDGTDWSGRIGAFKSFLPALTNSAPSQSMHTIALPQSVVDLWESIREMTSTHNVIFETADEEVSAHDLVLVAASPVLKAMLESTMKEGSSKRIPVKDSSGGAVRLFVDMLYTSSTRDEPDYKTVLVALDLAHRWQVDGVVSVLQAILRDMISVDSFVAIAETAMLKGLEPLQRACRAFAANNSKVKTMQKKRALPPEVLKLLGESEAPAAEQSQRKKRRTFAAC
ncbi:klhl40 [Symbiodinium sp. KB8]|nr:klhl40 [Symbiodinium sp. KB8]